MSQEKKNIIPSADSYLKDLEEISGEYDNIRPVKKVNRIVRAYRHYKETKNKNGSFG
jgi:hypothetical protein